MRFAEPVRSPAVSRLAVCAALALATAACSSDANRIDQQFTNPFTPTPTTTGSVAPQQPAPAPAYGQVQSQPLPPQYSQAAPQQQYQQPYRPAPAYQASQAANAPATVQPAAYRPQNDATGSVGSRPLAGQSPSQKNWDWNGGTPITVGQGETIQTVSRRYGVPAIVIAEANGMTTGTPIYPGQRLVIPKYGNSGRPATVPPAPQVAAAPAVTGSVRQTSPALAAQGQVHTVGPGETMFSIGRRYNVSPLTLAQANRLPPHHKLRMGERLTIPGTVARAQPQPQTPSQPQRPVQIAQTQAPAPVMAPAQRVAEAHSQPMPSARAITPAQETPSPIEQAKADQDEQVASNNAAGFRWPVRGRIIAGFGPKPTGQQNDGINIAVPEGTPVRASDDGVVAYSGNELKGYGNLVLVRHANGHVTAYAHASELLVKRGDTVKRGQTIAKSGQTGNVSSPQLHFEIRKGATPVDPMQFLTGAS
jgi:murein DD-endopeptidase MepM/ murein hydrolase activator NlpD